MNKTVRLILLAIVVFSAIAAIPRQPQPDASIGFGRGPNCIGRGVCSVQDDPPTGGGDENGSSEEARYPVQLSVLGNGHLLLTIEKADLPNQLLLDQFPVGKLMITDGFTIDDKVARRIGRSGEYYVPAGNYPLKVNAEDISVTMNLLAK